MSKEFKGLSLNRDVIKENTNKYLNMYFEGVSVGDLINRGGTRNRIDIKADDKQFYVDFHFNGDGTTTIEDFGGNNTEIKRNLAYYLKDTCSINDGKNSSWFVVKNIDKDDFDGILELLCDSEYYKSGYKYVTENKTNSIVYRLKGKYNEDLVLTYFNTKTVQIQGKPLLLFNEAIIMLSELLEVDEIPKTYNKFYNIQVDKDAVREKTKICMSNSYDKLNATLKKCIHQAIYYSLIQGDMFDYTAMPLTAFRALEGHIKYAFKEFGILTTRDRCIGNFFYKDGRVFKLNNDEAQIINNQYKIDCLGKAYTQYNKHRNMLSHWDDFEDGVDRDTTQFIDNIEVARGYILDTLEIIDEYYRL